MPSFRTTRRVNHSAANMFDLVADVEKYPQFVPLCESLRVRRREERNGLPSLVADMTVAYTVFRETFTSRVALDRPNLSILVNYIDGPFRHLENRWLFKPTEEGGCEITFSIDYEFRSRALALLMGAAFEKAFRKFSAAFEARADAIYGRA
ncbi:ubiquinone-binding protein [Agaricicola taiwanensis]|uniref:Ubiquinone-binding protein n=1 Tax=Agaricicola taiwanensis TaxID=591372 RepID=A0A8J3DVR2_9RHOB|nr:type II toxin-antitoxin system RatA family toxin [Agaricicola taiwanensis]GGE45414.1 ubiquinone-binding protein [Agaricicola taiwanensis]